MISHCFFKSPTVNVGVVGICSYMESFFSLSNIQNLTLSTLNYIDNVPDLTVSGGFNFKASTCCLVGECINSFHVMTCFTMGLATLTVTHYTISVVD